MRELFLYNRFILELLLMTGIYIIPLKKRSLWGWRMFGGVTICLLVASLTSPSEQQYVLLTLKFLSELGLDILLVYAVCEIALPDAVYCGACGYATQHFAYSLFDLFYVPIKSVISLVLIFHLYYPMVMVVFYYLFARPLSENGQIQVNVRQSLVSVLIVMLIVLGISTLSQYYYREYGGPIYIIYHLYSMFCCAFLLWVQVSQRRKSRTESEFAEQKQLWRRQQEQYQLTKENIDIINSKCHDLKHQITAFQKIDKDIEKKEYLAEIENSVRIYDSCLKTGNEVLDTVLMDKSLFCEAHQILLTCVADGGLLEFMNTMDIYAIFGNALDNAIESASELEQADEKMIDVIVWSRSGLLLIQVENYYCHEICFREGLPVTTKPQLAWHGFGMKSIKTTVEKYGGCMAVQAENHKFTLRISVPLQEQMGIPK